MRTTVGTELRCEPSTCVVHHGAQWGPTFFRSRGRHLSTNRVVHFIVIDREAGEIIRLVASVRLSVRLSVCPSVCLSVYTFTIISPRYLCVCLWSVAVSTCCAIAVDNAFNSFIWLTSFCDVIAFDRQTQPTQIVSGQHGTAEVVHNISVKASVFHYFFCMNGYQNEKAVYVSFDKTGNLSTIRPLTRLKIPTNQQNWQMIQSLECRYLHFRTSFTCYCN